MGWENANTEKGQKMKQLIFLILFLPALCFSQEFPVYKNAEIQLIAPVKYKYTHNWKADIAPGVLSLISGGSWGVNQVNKNHPEQMFAKRPWLSRKTWGPDSWKNKYVNFDPDQGRNNRLIFLTDADHFTGSLTQWSIYSAGVTNGSCFTIGAMKGKYKGAGKKKILYVAADIAISLGVNVASYSLGNIITYNLIMR